MRKMLAFGIVDGGNYEASGGWETLIDDIG